MCKFFNQHVHFCSFYIQFGPGSCSLTPNDVNRMRARCYTRRVRIFGFFGKPTNKQENNQEMDPISECWLQHCAHIAVIVVFSVPFSLSLSIFRFSSLSQCVCVCVWVFVFASKIARFVLNENCRHCVTAGAAKALHFSFGRFSFFLSFSLSDFAKHFIRFQLHQCNPYWIQYAIIWLYAVAVAVLSCCLCSSWIAFAHMHF